MGELERFDDAFVAALTAVTNTRFGENSLAQVALPVSLGGLGIRMSKDIALPAFISSLHAVQERVAGILINILLLESNDLPAAEREWGSGGLILAEVRDVGKQKSWSEPQAVAKAARLLEEAYQVSRARLLAAAYRKSGLWLHTLPTSTLGTLLDPKSLRIALALRVGADVCEPHMCCCGRRTDARSLHELSCTFSAGQHPRHAALNDIINWSLKSAGVPSILKPVGVDRRDGKRPDDITVFPFFNGRS